MQFRKLLTLRGPNIWANHPVMEAWLELQDLKLCTADGLPGFTDRLLAWVPSLVRADERDAFADLMRRDTSLGHVMERLSLDLQTRAGTPVNFSCTSKTHTDGLLKVVVKCEIEALGKAALDAALRICAAAIRNTPINVESELDNLRAICRDESPNRSTAALLKVARARRIPVRRLTSDGLLSLGYGHKQRRLQGTQTDRTSAAAESVTRDRGLTLSLLQQIGLPLPETEIVESPEDAWVAAEGIGLPVTIRPCRGAGRQRDRVDLKSRDQVENAYRRLASSDGRVSVEEQIAGHSWRLLVVGERLVSAFCLTPPIATASSAVMT
jgi:cyanophycin synthetase